MPPWTDAVGGQGTVDLEPTMVWSNRSVGRHRASGLIVRLSLAVSVAGGSAAAAGPPATGPSTAPASRPALTPQQAAAVAEIRRLDAQANALEGQGKYADSIPLRARIVALVRALFGGRDQRYAGCLCRLANLYDQLGDYPRAEPLYRRATDIDRAALGERDPQYATCLNNLAHVYDQMGDHARAGPMYRQATEIRRAALGERHPDYAESLNDVAVLYYETGDYARAEPLYCQAMEIRRAALGELSPAYAESLNNLAALYSRMADYARAEQLYRKAVDVDRFALGEHHPGYAARLNNLGYLYYQMGDYARAERLYRQAMEIRRASLGELNPEYAQSLNNLALLFEQVGDHARAEPLYRQAVEIDRATLGERHPGYATSLDNLATAYDHTGDYARAEPLYRQAMEIRRVALGEHHTEYAASLNNLANMYADMGDYVRAEPLAREATETIRAALGLHHPDYASSLNNLASLYDHMGDYARADPLYRQAMEIRRAALGGHHPDYAQSLNNLAFLYDETGDHARAEPLYRQAMEIRRAALGARHPDYAQSLNNLARLYDEAGDDARAEPLYRQALDIKRAALGEHHPDYATGLNNLAGVYEDVGDDARAESMYRQALAIERAALGEHHPDYATSLNNLAGLYLAVGDRARAEPLYRQASEIDRTALGEHHPQYAADISNLACVYHQMGDDARAAPLARQALGITARQADLTAAVQSERQQLLSAEAASSYANIFLTASTAVPADAAYDALLPAKGLVSLRQQKIRAVQGGPADPATAALRAELASASGRLSRQSRAAAAGPTTRAATDARASIDQLSERVEQLQRDLAAKDAAYRQSRDQLRRTAAEVAAALPPDAVLVDVREYEPLWRAGHPRELRLAAFVARHGQPVARVELGAASPVEAAVDQWRQTFGAGATGVAAATTLRQLIWQPLLDHAGPQMAGATTVLFSPDGALGRFPLAALPGERPGTYLIDDLAVADVAVPAALPELLAPSTRPASPPSLLLVGDVDYGAAAGKPPTTEPAALASAEPLRRSAARGANERFGMLPGTRTEIAAVGQQFAEAFPKGAEVELQGGQATVSAVRADVARARWVHIATHGFFADPSKRSAVATDNGRPTSMLDRLGGDDRVTGFHPGLLSGLALAGANAPTDADDGILTALEMEELDLSGVDLAVLSACDTGLGKSAGGEGLLGLQRSLQVAGAHTVVASLWQVDDEATQRLMARFYDNVWRPGKDGRPLGKLAALREAQLWLRSQTLSSAAHRGLAGAAADDGGSAGQLPPRYWAAFVLSGDWR
jgi:CHAT domain-containing protein/Tfp pilus assembly protein PilF